MIRNILWDFDGTLFDTYPAMATSFQAQLRAAYGVEEPLDTILEKMQQTLRTAYSYYEERYGVTDDFIREYKARRREAELAGAKPFAEVPQLLSDIRAHGRHSYIYTHRGESTFFLLGQYGLSGFFDGAVTSKDGFPLKPDPSAIRHLIKAHGLDPQATLMVGDRELDVEAGINAGVRSCLFDPSMRRTTAADFHIATLSALRPILGIDGD